MVRLNWCGKDREKVEVEVEVEVEIEVEVEVKIEVEVQRTVFCGKCFWFLVFGFWFIRSREIP
jgi:hypothetical protein